MDSCIEGGTANIVCTPCPSTILRTLNTDMCGSAISAIGCSRYRIQHLCARLTSEDSILHWNVGS
jgi:hypothetical protein